MAKYKLLRGRHSQNKITYIAGKNDVVESNVDLVKKHGAEKFDLIDKAPAPTPKKGGKGKKAEPNHGDDTLGTMTVEELRAFAEEEEIDLGGASTKEEVLEVVRTAMSAR